MLILAKKVNYINIEFFLADDDVIVYFWFYHFVIPTLYTHGLYHGDLEYNFLGTFHFWTRHVPFSHDMATLI